jgi:hypothetical protein
MEHSDEHRHEDELDGSRDGSERQVRRGDWQRDQDVMRSVNAAVQDPDLDGR